ncbi:hypothetical protein OAN22_01380 [Alphaproteobacteria bacterium]|nr:hypothetical protein [Alphaproteobacteria bacterium]
MKHLFLCLILLLLSTKITLAADLDEKNPAAIPWTETVTKGAAESKEEWSQRVKARYKAEYKKPVARGEPQINYDRAIQFRNLAKREENRTTYEIVFKAFRECLLPHSNIPADIERNKKVYHNLGDISVSLGNFHDADYYFAQAGLEPSLRNNAKLREDYGAAYFERKFSRKQVPTDATKLKLPWATRALCALAIHGLQQEPGDRQTWRPCLITAIHCGSQAAADILYAAQNGLIPLHEKKVSNAQVLAMCAKDLPFARGLMRAIAQVTPQITHFYFDLGKKDLFSGPLTEHMREDAFITTCFFDHFYEADNFEEDFLQTGLRALDMYPHAAHILLKKAADRLSPQDKERCRTLEKRHQMRFDMLQIIQQAQERRLSAIIGLGKHYRENSIKREESLGGLFGQLHDNTGNDPLGLFEMLRPGRGSRRDSLGLLGMLGQGGPRRLQDAMSVESNISASYYESLMHIIMHRPLVPLVAIPFKGIRLGANPVLQAQMTPQKYKGPIGFEPPYDTESGIYDAFCRFMKQDEIVPLNLSMRDFNQVDPRLLQLRTLPDPITPAAAIAHLLSYHGIKVDGTTETHRTVSLKSLRMMFYMMQNAADATEAAEAIAEMDKYRH